MAVLTSGREREMGAIYYRRIISFQIYHPAGIFGRNERTYMMAISIPAQSWSWSC